MYLWISGGGSGGHVYPGLTVCAAATPERHRFLWLGRSGSMEEALVRQEGLAFAAVSAAAWVGKGPRGRLAGLALALRGLWQTWRLAGRERPDALLVTGGYVSVPVGLGAWLRRVPLFIYLPDLRPGRAIRSLAPLARRIAITAPDAAAALPPAKTELTGYPVRALLRQADRAAARQGMGLTAEDRLLLVFGGSQGARRINLALAGAAPGLLSGCHILHICGAADHAALAERASDLPAALQARYHLHAYLDSQDMAAALAAADLVVCRAGAATLGELPAMGLPSLLVPLPIAGGHQWPNAQYLAAAGAAEILADPDCDAAGLGRAVQSLWERPAALAAMGRAARALDRPGAAEAIWTMIETGVARPHGPLREELDDEQA